MAMKTWTCSECNSFNQVDDVGVEWAKCSRCGCPHPVSVNAIQDAFCAATEKEKSEKRGTVGGCGCLTVLFVFLTVIWWLLPEGLWTWLKVALSILALPFSIWSGILIAKAFLGKEETVSWTGGDNSKFGTCAYAMEVSGGESSGAMGVIPIFQCCKHSKAAQDCEKISGFADFSTGHDGNSVEGVAYKLNSTERCEKCGFYKRKLPSAGD